MPSLFQLVRWMFCRQRPELADLQAWRDALRAAEEANASLAVLLRMLPDMVWFKDAAGRYQFASDAFFAFHGFSREHALNRTAAELFSDQYTPGILQGDQRVIDSGQRYYNEMLVAASDGRPLWLDTIKTPVYDADGHLLGILGTSHDITARKLAEEALARQARYAGALSRSAQLLLARGESQWTRVGEALEHLRAAVGVSRAFVCGHNVAPDVPSSLVAESLEPGEPAYVARRINWDEAPPDFAAALAERRWFGGPTAGRWPDYPGFQALYDEDGVKSILVVPVYVDGRLWGHMGLSDKQAPREWDDATIQLLFTAAEMIAATIAGWEDARALRERTAAAEAADRAKSAFLATMSHEIRTPLNAVVGTVDLLADMPLNPAQRTLADLIRGGGETLLEIVNTILDFSKIESGRLDLELRPFDLFACLDEAAGMVAGSAAHKGVTLDIRRAPDLPRYVVGDVTRVRRVLLNLLSNAVKFTAKGNVTLAAAVAQPEAGAVPLISFEVRDTGIGIAADRLDEIFEPFTQADSSTTRRYGGTGLGLAICRELAALMGGWIEVQSVVGTGSTFTVLLPLPVAAGPVADVALSEARATAFENSLRVLVVEDNEVNQEVTLRMLARLGYNAEVAADGAAAVAAVVTRAYDVVLMDVQMPELDGVEATRRIRALGAFIHQPRIIALTANAVSGDSERYLQAGMDAYLRKPVRLQTLREALAPTEAPVARAPAPEPAFAPALVDWYVYTSQVEALSSGPQGGAALMGRLLTAEIRRQLDTMAEQLARGDRAALAAAAHKLRGACGQLGARALAERCAELERAALSASTEQLTAGLEALRECHVATVEAVEARAQQVGGR